MSPGRRRPCSRSDGKTRLRHAEAYLEAARTVVGDPNRPEDYDFSHVSAGIAVLAAIAAADALCCVLLGERSRGQNHHEAVDLLSTLRLGSGTPAAQARQAHELAAALSTALDLKDESHYGTRMLSGSQVRRAIRAAEKLVVAAREAMTA